MQFTVVQPADGHRKPVADFTSHRPLFGKLDVMRIRRSSTANDTWLLMPE
jgi:hypothetical protein